MSFHHRVARLACKACPRPDRGSCLNILVFAFLLSSCNNDPLHTVAALNSQYNFKQALVELENLDPEIRKSDEAIRLELQARMVEGQLDQAFSIIEGQVELGTATAYDFAHTLLEAAEIAMRQSERVRIAVTLLDSVVRYDPGLRAQAMRAAFRRAEEYLEVRTDAGWRLMDFCERQDGQADDRLRATKRVLSLRYGQMSAVMFYLRMLSESADKLQDALGRQPYSIEDIGSQGFAPPEADFDKGWDISLLHQPDGTVGFKAVARKNNPGRVIAGTVLTYP